MSGVEIMLRAVGKTAGIEAHPHTLRHSFASHMIEQGVPYQLCTGNAWTPLSGINTGIHPHIQ